MAIIVGTRPEIIKMSPVIKECMARRIEHIVVHSGQHYSYLLNGIFFKELGLREPDVNLKVGSGTHAAEIAKTLLGMEKILEERSPDLVLCQGDTNTVLAASIAASRAGISIGHVEAGLRSGDLTMPEEINRIIADRLSDILFAPAEKARDNLLREGIEPEKIFITGNTIVDAVLHNIDQESAEGLLTALGLEEGRYFLLTLHRQENVDRDSSLSSILEGLRRVKEETRVDILFPAHPRTLKNMQRLGISSFPFRLLDPLGYKDFLRLLSKAGLVMTDSGGVQEEACILQIPCVTLRTSTERPETVEVGSNIVAGIEPDGIMDGVKKMLAAPRNWPNPYGDGTAGKKIVEIIEERLS